MRCWQGTIPLHMYKAMLSMRMSPTTKVCQNAEDQHLYVKQAKISYRGVPPWQKHNPKVQHIPMGVAAEEEGRTRSEGSSMEGMQAQRPTAMWLACPECHFWTDMCKVTLISHGRWRAIRCTKCQGNRVSSKWSCACGRKWANCNVHAQSGLACGTCKHRRTVPKTTHHKAGFEIDEEGYPIDLPLRVAVRPKCKARREYPVSADVTPPANLCPPPPLPNPTMDDPDRTSLQACTGEVFEVVRGIRYLREATPSVCDGGPTSQLDDDRPCPHASSSSSISLQHNVEADSSTRIGKRSREPLEEDQAQVSPATRAKRPQVQQNAGHVRKRQSDTSGSGSLASHKRRKPTRGEQRSSELHAIDRIREARSQPYEGN